MCATRTFKALRVTFLSKISLREIFTCTGGVLEVQKGALRSSSSVIAEPSVISCFLAILPIAWYTFWEFFLKNSLFANFLKISQFHCIFLFSKIPNGILLKCKMRLCVYRVSGHSGRKKVKVWNLFFIGL